MKTPKINTRAAAIDDVTGIHVIHAVDEDPWADIARCAIWVNHRLLRGFIVEVAEIDEEVVGHAEWIKSVEPAPIAVRDSQQS